MEEVSLNVASPALTPLSFLAVCQESLYWSDGGVVAATVATVMVMAVASVWKWIRRLRTGEVWRTGRAGGTS